MAPAEETDWTNFQVEEISFGTFVKRNLIHWNLLVEAYRRGARGVLEVGAGSGAQSALLSRVVTRVVTVDNDHRILGRARINLERHGPRTKVVAADAFRLPFPDRAFGVSISQGLMEHFDDAAIGALIVEQARVCDSIVFSVPSDRYPRQDVGNERLMSPRRWLEIARRSLPPDAYRVRSRYYRADLESLKYSALARRRLGSFSVLVTIDRAAS